MGKRVFLAAVLMLLSSMAFADHAISLEPNAAATVAPEPPAPAMAPERAMAPVVVAEPATAPTVMLAPQPAPKVEVTLPSELDVYLVPAATRQVCTTSEWGYGEVRTDCRAQPVPVRRDDPALRGLCVTRYGQRTCY